MASEVKYRRAPYFVTPEVIDASGAVNDGLDNEDLALTEKEKEAARKAFPVSQELSYPVRHNQQFNMNTPYELGLLALALTDPLIAKSKKDLQATDRFYIEREQAESRDKAMNLLSKRKALDVASDIVENGTVETIRDMVRLIERVADVSKISEIKAIELLMAEADERPVSFLNKMNDEHRNQKVFIKKLVEFGLLSKRKDGYYNINGNRMATTIEELIDFIKSPKNQVLIDNWGEQIGDYRLTRSNQNPPSGNSQPSQNPEGSDAGAQEEKSTDYKGKALLDKMDSITSVDELKKFVEGDERKMVAEKLKDRIEFLSAGASA